ncbi:MAG: hypothetical protein IKR56_10410 [Lachnospiraceae bacterium]|nr:hypothetical protein [Lachnospiraceae bacterium]
MELSDGKLREYTKRILRIRMKLLCEQSFFGLLLMNVKMGLSDAYDTAWTDVAEHIFFNPEFMEELSDGELQYVLEHEIMHIVLAHVERMREGNFDRELYNIASDIVVNSNILKAHGGDEKYISLANFDGPQMHRSPDGREGCEYTVEEIYRMLDAMCKKNDGKDKLGEDGYAGWDEHMDPQDDADSEQDGDGEGGGEGDNDRDDNDKEGNDKGGNDKGDNDKEGNDKGNIDKRQIQRDLWIGRIINAVETLAERAKIGELGDKGVGNIPGLVERFFEEYMDPKVDWRMILNDFIQEEFTDYSFTPPDRRFYDSPFFLPDYNDTEYKVENLLFMIDTSGSMSTEEISQAYGEIKSAVDQFNGKLKGLLGFFDACVYDPVPFEDEEELRVIRPKGGGGTRFDIIFEYVDKNMMDEPPVCIIIMTDGMTDFPDEEAAMEIPVLWLINNEDIDPPWGVVARM